MTVQTRRYDSYWPQRTAHKILNALDSEFSLVHSDAWQCAMEITIGLYLGPRLSAPLYVLIVTDDSREVATFTRSLRRVLGYIRADDPGWGWWNPRGKKHRVPKRGIKYMLELKASEQKPIVIAKCTRAQAGKHFRPLYVLGLIEGAVSIMESVLTHERAHGYSWTRSQELVMQLARKQCVPCEWASKVLEQVEAVYLKRNATHTQLMNVGADFEIVVKGLIRSALNRHHQNGSEITQEETKALFGGQNQEYIHWLALQLANGDQISHHRAAEWLAQCT